MSIFDRIRSADRATRDNGDVRRGAVSGLSSRRTKVRPFDWEGLRTEIAVHLASTQMSLASHERGYNLLIPGHSPISFGLPHSATGFHKPVHPFFYEETTTLLLSFLIARFQTSLLFDIGAGLGYFSRVAASHIKHAPSVYAFEMRPDRMAQLEANIANDPFGTRIHPQLAGLTDSHKGPTDIWYASSILFETRPDAADYKERLDSVVTQYRSRLTNLSNPKVAAVHEIYDYLARDFGFQIVDIIEKEPGQEPSARETIALSGELRRNKIAAIFAEPQYSERMARTLASELKVSAYVIDPVATGPSNPPRDYYETVMLENLENLVKAMK